MNILIKSTYAQTDSWGRSAKDYMKVFYDTSHNVRSIPIVLSQQVGDVPNWVKQPDSSFVIDVFFQQCLPHYFERVDRLKNIGFTFTESKHLEKTGWIEKFNEMDEVWVATKMEKDTLINSGVTRKIEVVPMPMEFLDVPPVKGFNEYIGDRFSFYFIGEYIERKNIEALISAYWREFTRDEKVVLFIKTGYGGVPPQEMTSIINKTLEQMRVKMRLHTYSHHYPEILFFTEKLEDSEIAEIHSSCDCFVTASRGESTCRPLIDAAYYNNQIICTDNISCVEDLDMLKVRSFEVPCSAYQPPIRNLYTGYETWMNIDIIDLQTKMRQAFTNKIKVNNRERVIEKHSYESVSKRISDLL